MKKTKILAPALGILCLSMAASVTGTVAWFAANQTVYAKGMTVKSTTPASLVISKGSPNADEKVTGETVAGWPVGKKTSIEFTDADLGKIPGGSAGVVPTLSPATHDDDSTEFASLLKYVDNGQYVDPATGMRLEKDPENLESACPELTYSAASANSHYIDYVVYIASSGDAIQGDGTAQNPSRRLTVELLPVELGENGDTIQAMSVDFYVSTVNDTTREVAEVATNYAGTLNLAGLDIASNRYVDGAASQTRSGTAKASVDLIDSTQSMPIPKNTSNTAIRITMRVYFDGALLKDTDQCYCYTNSIDTSEIQFTAKFDLKNTIA